MVEQLFCNQQVVGSIPTLGSMKNKHISPNPQLRGSWYHGGMDEEESLPLVCVVNCPDCDTTVISESDFVSVFVLFEQLIAIAMCGYCERPVSCEISKELAEEFAELGVKIFSWESGLEVGIAGVQHIQ
jgi:hypothetical protein